MEIVEDRATLQPGEMLNCYRITRVLGRGGFGVTYLAQDTYLHLDVAIKEYLPGLIAKRGEDNSVNPSTTDDYTTFRWGLRSFLKEARTLVKFKHPNIVRVMAVFESNGTAYMVMEYEQGQDLKKLLAKSHTLSETQLRSLLLPIIDGLAEVHKHGFIHRDIKPANIYIRENNTPVLLDFGSARLALDGATQQLTSLVSAGYTPLEQYGHSVNNQQGPWTDIYSLGAVMYFAISGTTPVDSTQRALAVLNDKPDPLRPLSDLGRGRYSAEFLSAIDWALEFKDSDRPRSLDAWQARLNGDDRTVLKVDNQKNQAHRAQSATQYSVSDKAADLARTRSRHQSALAEKNDRKPIQPRFHQAKPPQRSAPVPEPALKIQHEPGARRASDDIDTFAVNDPNTPAESEYALQTPITLHTKRQRFRPWMLLLLAAPLGLIAYLSLTNSENALTIFNSDTSQDRYGPGSSVSQNNATQSPQVAQANQRVASQQGSQNEAAQQAREMEAARQTELAEQQAQDREAARQAELTAQQAQDREAARQAELAAQQAQDREAARQAELTAQQAQDREAARQAELAAQQAQDREAARQAELAAQQAQDREAARQAELRAQETHQEDAVVQTRLAANETALVKDTETSIEPAKPITPISDQELQESARRFNDLARSIRMQDLDALKEIAPPSNRYDALFAFWFSNFKEIDVDITRISANRISGRVNARLNIKQLVRENGDIVLPAQSYRSISIYTERLNDGWSMIQWPGAENQPSADVTNR